MKNKISTLLILATAFVNFATAAPNMLTVNKGDNIVIIGAGLASRMNHFGHFETELQLRYPDMEVTIRNMGDEGNTPGFRPQPGRNDDQQFAFPGASKPTPSSLSLVSIPPLMALSMWSDTKRNSMRS